MQRLEEKEEDVKDDGRDQEDCAQEISMEEGQVTESEEDSWDLSNVIDLFKDYKMLKAEFQKLKEDCDTKIKSIVTDVVKSVLKDFKREVINDLKKEIKLDTIQTDMKKFEKIVKTTKRQ